MARVESSNVLDMLQKKRDALQSAIRVALVVERLNRCLEAMLISRNPGGYLPQQALQYYEGLGEQAHTISTPMVKEYIGRLEERVGVDYRLILEITRITGSPSPQDAALAEVVDIDGFVAGFSANASKLVGLRVLLHKRGEKSPGLQLEIPKQSLQKRLKQISDLEGCYREKVRHDVKQMQQETLALFDNPQLTDQMRELVQQIHEDLLITLRHIEEGKPLAEIPVKVQTIHIADTPLSSELFCSQIARMGAEGSATAEETVRPVVEKQPEPVRRSFWQTLKIWLNTPFRVSWRDIREGRH